MVQIALYDSSAPTAVVDADFKNSTAPTAVAGHKKKRISNDIRLEIRIEF